MASRFDCVFVGFFLVATLAPPGCASSSIGDVETGDLLLRMNGRGGWTMDCSATTKRGNTAKNDARGRGMDHLGSVFLAEVVTARCEYDTGDQPMLVTMEDRGLPCPFGPYDDGVCSITFPAGEQGIIEI